MNNTIKSLALLLTLSFSCVSAQGKQEQPVNNNKQPVEHTDTEPNSELTEWCNTASPEELQKVKGIGPSTSAKIISGRPYKTAHDVLAVKGIGKVKLAAIVAYIDRTAL